jgi:hypothetical protein
VASMIRVFYHGIHHQINDVWPSYK